MGSSWWIVKAAAETCENLSKKFAFNKRTPPQENLEVYLSQGFHWKWCLPHKSKSSPEQFALPSSIRFPEFQPLSRDSCTQQKRTPVIKGGMRVYPQYKEWKDPGKKYERLWHHLHDWSLGDWFFQFSYGKQKHIPRNCSSTSVVRRWIVELNLVELLAGQTQSAFRGSLRC